MRGSVIRKIVLAAALVGASAPLAADVPHNWQTYTNARYGYSVCYPADLLHPQQEAANGDGRAFLAANSASLISWGGYNVLERTITQAKDDDVARLSGGGFSITYQVVRPGWYVLSGSGKAGTFYKRKMLSRDREVTFELRYPSAEAGVWNPIAARMSHCLKD